MMKKYRPNIIDFSWNLSGITFETCGLNKENNFLEAPICLCGCGGKTNIVLETDDDVLDFCGAMCDENDCYHCAVFAINNENKLLAAICEGYDIHLVESEDVIEDYKDIGKMFDELGLHCFGLIVSNGDGSYKVVEE